MVASAGTANKLCTDSLRIDDGGIVMTVQLQTEGQSDVEAKEVNLMDFHRAALSCAAGSINKLRVGREFGTNEPTALAHALEDGNMSVEGSVQAETILAERGMIDAFGANAGHFAAVSSETMNLKTATASSVTVRHPVAVPHGLALGGTLTPEDHTGLVIEVGPREAPPPVPHWFMGLDDREDLTVFQGMTPRVLFTDQGLTLVNHQTHVADSAATSTVLKTPANTSGSVTSSTVGDDTHVITLLHPAGQPAFVEGAALFAMPTHTHASSWTVSIRFVVSSTIAAGEGSFVELALLVPGMDATLGLAAALTATTGLRVRVYCNNSSTTAQKITLKWGDNTTQTIPLVGDFIEMDDEYQLSVSLNTTSNEVEVTLIDVASPSGAGTVTASFATSTLLADNPASQRTLTSPEGYPWLALRLARDTTTARLELRASNLTVEAVMEQRRNDEWSLEHFHGREKEGRLSLVHERAPKLSFAREGFDVEVFGKMHSEELSLRRHTDVVAPVSNMLAPDILLEGARVENNELVLGRNSMALYADATVREDDCEQIVFEFAVRGVADTSVHTLDVNWYLPGPTHAEASASLRDASVPDGLRLTLRLSAGTAANTQQAAFSYKGSVAAWPAGFVTFNGGANEHLVDTTSEILVRVVFSGGRVTLQATPPGGIFTDYVTVIDSLDLATLNNNVTLPELRQALTFPWIGFRRANDASVALYVSSLVYTARKKGKIPDTGASAAAWRMRLDDGSQDLLVSDGDTTHLRVDHTSGDVHVVNDVVAGGNVVPAVSETVSLGSASRRWQDIYSLNPVSVSSDERLKSNIEELSPEEGFRFVRQLKPASYNWSGDVEGWGAVSNPVRHYGLIAQQVETVVDDMGYDTTAFGPFHRRNEPHAENDNDSECADSNYRLLRYDEFLPFVIASIQHMSERLDRVEVQLEQRATRPTTHDATQESQPMLSGFDVLHTTVPTQDVDFE